MPEPPAEPPRVPVADRAAELIEDLSNPNLTLAEIVRARKIRPAQLRRRVRSQAARRAMEIARELNALRAHLILENARLDGLCGLVRIASQSDSHETSRKACVDLLRSVASADPDIPSGPRTPTPAEADAVRALLERLDRVARQRAAALAERSHPKELNPHA